MSMTDTAVDRLRRSRQAIDFITSCCQSIGVFNGAPLEIQRYLNETASQMAVAPASDVLPDRYIKHVAHAVDMVAFGAFMSPPAAIASVYLATRFEFYFRIFSGKLKGNGNWISDVTQEAAKSAIQDKHLGGKQISSVSLAYKIMKLDPSRPFVQQCDALDKVLYPSSMAGGGKIVDIGKRIEFARNAAGHGQWGDISAEAFFYGLMTALVFYSA